MKVLVIGGSGMLGHKLVQVLKKRFDVRTTLRSDYEKYADLGIFDAEKTFSGIDVEDFETVENLLDKLKPEVVINAVGIIKQLPSSKNVVKTLSVNSIFPHRIAEALSHFDSRLITISTDCVFDGKKGGYTEEDIPNAVDLYGKSKNLGEVVEGNCLTLRTSIIGRELETGHSLVEWFLGNEWKTIKGFKNAIYSGFPTVVLADIISDLIENQKNLRGLFHVSSEPINKYELLCLIKKEFNLNIEIEPESEFQIDRSLDSTKFRKMTGFAPLDWDEMIKRMANDPTPYNQWRKRIT
jgi:dTDP-4-dehydrorhamnose reductase